MSTLAENRPREYEYKITQHGRQRYIERFIHPEKYYHLTSCSHKGCNDCMNLLFELTEYQNQFRKNIDREISTRLSRSTASRSYVNNSEFMDYIYRRYGYEKFEFLVDNDILFVILYRDGTKIVATCLETARTVVAGVEARHQRQQETWKSNKKSKKGRHINFKRK